MAEEEITTSAEGSALAAQMALGQTSAEARDYLRKQSRLADLQIDTLQKKDEFELSHLRFRRFSDYARFSLEIAGFLVVLLLVLGLASMVWNATQDHDLVVDAFSVPADVAQSGMTGSVLAGRVLDRFGAMQTDITATTQAASSYRADSGEAVRVEIPDTGVSLGELDRYLREWLGQETYVSGDLVHTPQGFALTTRYGAQPGVTVEGKAGDLDTLVTKSAEQVFAAARPYRHVEYLVRQRRFAEAEALIPALAQQGSAKDRALANAAWAKIYFFEGDMVRALEKGREAVRLDPGNAITHAWLAVGEANLGHDEATRQNSDEAQQFLRNGNGSDFDPLVAQFLFTAYRDESTGDFAEAGDSWKRLAALTPMRNAYLQSAAADAAGWHDIALARSLVSDMAAKDSQGRPDAQVPLAQMAIAEASGDWAAAVKQGLATDALLRAQSDQTWGELLMTPELAYAMAMTGDRKRADALIATTPRDCDDCLRRRGDIAALEGRFAEAEQDFATVAARSPHTPYAETEWGAMLLARGDLEGAIAKFQIANQKGPHFADPLGMWGEALIRQNRSDLARAKFAEAARYAPAWGRLHLKWGEALLWSGDKEGARKQFAIASGLALSPQDRLVLIHHG
ncbi:MAG TPA: hypothetical protein VGG48_05500 [Rhizomicrobium sp.]|jgi:tetratricopeptide (TPR) repeat protein